VHGGARAAAAALDRRAAARVRVLGAGRLADEVLRALAGCGVAVTAVADPRDDDPPPARAGHLDVLADAVHPDVPDAWTALAADRPHLPVAAWGRRGRVGPLVVPGLTACLRCADLHRADRDPAWPRLAAQLAHQRPLVAPVDAALATAMGGLAALRVTAWVDRGGHPGGGGPDADTVLELTLPGGAVRVRSAHPHPLCGCRWQPG
jgi:bacteriocin biosynthesis cyclodehydratase domain-containing protein